MLVLIFARSAFGVRGVLASLLDMLEAVDPSSYKNLTVQWVGDDAF